MINVLLFVLLSKNLLLLIIEFTLKSKNITINKKVLFTSFFAKAKKLVVDVFLNLSFNLVTLDFANCERLLKTTTTIFLKSFLFLIDLLIATTTRRNQEN